MSKHHLSLRGMCVLVMAFLFGLTFGGLVRAQKAQGLEYPAPRYPKLREVKSAADLLEIARVVVRKPSRRETLRPGYNVKPGEKVMMVIPSTFDPLVRDALAMAIREAGARLDIVLLSSSEPGEASGHGGLPQDGTVEATRMLDPQAGGGQYYQKIMALAKADRYDLLIEGSGGPQPVSAFRWERIPWSTAEKFILSASFPAEVQDIIDRKVWDAFKNARRIHITDPEGTDLTWSVKPEHLEKLLKEYDDPIYPRGTYDVVKRGHISLTPLFLAMPDIDAKGTVAGTINHAGVFPYTKLYLEGGKIARVEAGGRYGEAIQQVLKKYETVQYPGFPGKGVGWFIEAALGTNPKIARVTTVTKGEGMTWERGRSGVIHWGFGVSIPVTASHTKAYREKVEAENLTRGHFHIHTYFNTIDVETADGKTVQVADKGRITFLDDPEVRRIAAQYGDPDDLLQEAWIPAVPGINVKGDYMKDYGSYPERWIKVEVEQHEKNSATKPR
ncbi:MAG: hypothetical protein HY652_12030 [Acidobacteria bacterium]|nr:hypothetical protein [Acidobacteriota bacterium]